ncbi:MAG: hypothetical protein U0586_10370 [Candidatus Brocadiaceae bacterium]
MNISIEDQLGLISFEVDKEKHIKVETSICRQCVDKPCLRSVQQRGLLLKKETLCTIMRDVLNAAAASLPVPKVQ